ncbi:DUF2933 domain-containing protein [Candidatus Gottesmanbacteria bacterium]|nr:DUF2933 domain-containing protein [Candidatus Gottesmanbacteria bacterium]
MKPNFLWIIGIILAFISGSFLFGGNSISSLAPYALVLICPLMMIFMMKDHKH